MSPRHALPMQLEYALLGLIRQRPQYGYEILQSWSTNLGLIWNVKPANLYLALNKLERQRLLNVSRVPGEASPERKVFTLTPAGEEAFLTWMRTPVASPRAFRQEWFATVVFLSPGASRYHPRTLCCPAGHCRTLVGRAEQSQPDRFTLRESGARFSAQPNR